MNTSIALLRIPEEEYHAASRRGEFISSHLLGDFRKSPALYHREISGLVPSRDSTAFAFGRAVHKLTLEGRAAFDAEYFVGAGPVNPKTGEPFGTLTKAYRDWAAQYAPRVVLSPAEYERIDRLAGAVRGHPAAARLFEKGTPEGVVRAKYCGLDCQIRIDWFNDAEGIVDLKSCEDLDRFELDARKYGYMEQMAFYRAVLRVAAMGASVPVHIVAVEKNEPFRAGVWALSPECLDRSERANEDALRRLGECFRDSTWPTGYEEERILTFA